MLDAQRKSRTDFAYFSFLSSGAASLLIGAGTAYFAYVPMDAGAAVGGSMLFSLLIGVPALLVGLAGLVCGVILTILLRGPPPLIALVVLAALFAASGFVDFKFGSVALIDIASLVYGALAVTVPLLWFFRWRRQFSADARRGTFTIRDSRL
jgi:hypothetical protein